MKVQLRQQSVRINAPRSVVFGQLAALAEADGEKDPEKGEGARVLEKEGNRLLMEFHSRDGRKLYRTVEEVVLYPEERITFRHLEGPLYHSQEEFSLAENDGGTQMTHRGEIECRMHWLPGMGWMVARFYVRRRYERLVLRHMLSLKEKAEAAPA